MADVPEDEKDYSLYSGFSLLGAVLFVLEPIADIIGSWVGVWMQTLDQA